MSERPDWTDCLYRPAMCSERGEKLGHDVDMREFWRMTQLSPQPQLQPETPVETRVAPTEAPAPTPLPELTPTEMQIPIRHKGLFFSSYWFIVNDVYAGVGDVVVIRSPGDYVILRRTHKSRQWLDDTQLRIAGYVERRLCIYGFVLSRDIERIASEMRSGRFALVAMCDPRAVVKPPRREELYNIWRFEGYLVNTAPAKMALIRLDMSRKPKFAVDYLRKGCPIYSQHLNQILQLSGIPIQLTC
jgi:hypothetical protein